MSDPKYSGTGADWTQLLTDPALVSHLGELLQVYRDSPPEQRDQALLEAMRNIKGGTGKAVAIAKAAAEASQTSVARDHTMARNHDGDPVLPVGRAHRSRRRLLLRSPRVVPCRRCA